MSENQARDEVIRKNGDLYRAAQIESGVETVTKSEPGSAVHQLSRAADSMVRTHRGISGHDEAYARVAAANPRLHAAALDELSDSDDDIGKGELVSFRKGNVRVNKNAVANDACERLQAIIERLKQSGMDGWAAELRAKQANPELWEMAMGAPDDAESLEPPQAITCRERGK